MRKLFISQPMADRTNEEILEEREILHKQAEKVFGQKFAVVDSFFKDAEELVSQKGRLYLMGQSISKMAEASYVIFHWDYRNYRGCRLEFQAATEYSPECIKGILVAVDPNGDD